MSHFKLRQGEKRVGIALLLFLLLLSACASAMDDQARLEPLEYSAFFEDGRSARDMIPNTIARGSVLTDTVLSTGRAGDSPVEEFPFALGEAELERGQLLYNHFCAPCHDQVGTGNGIVVQRGYSPAPTLHQPRLRDAPVGYLYDVITNGFGAMPAYGPQLQMRERWMIVGYIRALQRSQNATIEDVPAEQRELLGTGGTQQ